MKKILVIISVIFLSACFGGKKVVEENNNNQNKTPNVIEELEKEEEKENSKKEEGEEGEKEEETAFIKVNPLDDKAFIEITPIESDEIQNYEIQIKGKVLKDGVDTIIVHFENKSSDFPEDDYTLQTFSEGDESFRYVASAGFRVLDFGENYYTFTAYKGEETSSIEVLIFIPEEDEEEKEENSGNDEDKEDNSGEYEKEEESKLINISDLGVNLPESEVLGKPLILSGGVISYENDTQLKISQKETALFSCETPEKLNEYLFENYSWVYWNTCRNIVYTPKEEDTKAIYFNVLYLEDESYFYERHYVDFENELYGVYLLESGMGVDKNTIAEKNAELKQKEFSQLEEVNKIFETIIK